MLGEIVFSLMKMKVLPINSILPDLRMALRQGRHAVLQAPPGAGKTTGIPPALLDEPWLAGRRIIMLEPRRLAARAAAERMASLLGERVGQTVGYRIRLDSKVGPHTRIEVVTEGILTRRIQNDPTLSGVGLVIFDEFHERSIHADLGLALCLDAQTALREDLRLLVMSATLAGGPVAALIGNAPIITGHGQSFPVETRYTPISSPSVRTGALSVQEREVVRVILTALREDAGDLLVFLPGTPEIRRTERLLKEAALGPDIIIAPLAGTLCREAQDQAVQPPPPGMRKIVLATSVAETSLTIEGVRVVIDSGCMRVARFDPRSDMTRLETVRVTRAAADQRRGRAGRTAPGICYRLWRPEDEAGFAPFNEPEIRQADMTPLALELALWGIADPGQLSWLDAPPEAAFARGRALLADLDALDGNGMITEEGRRLAAFGLHPRLAHMLRASARIGLGRLACETAALLSERDIIRDQFGPRSADLRLRLEILHALRDKTGVRFNADMPLARRILELALRLEDQLEHTLGPLASLPSAQEASPAALLDQIGLVLAFAYPDRIARRRAGTHGKYLLSGGRGAWLPETDPLSREEFLVVAELDGAVKESQIFLAVPIDVTSLEDHFAGHITIDDFSGWDDSAQAVVSRRRHVLGRLVLRETPLRSPGKETVARALLEGILSNGLEALPWTKEARVLRARIAFLQRIAPEPDAWPDVSDAGLLDSLEHWLMPFVTDMTRLTQLQNIDLKHALKTLLTREQQHRLDALAPTHIEVPSGSRIPLDYENADIPILAVRLQEMFGCTVTPVIAGGIPVMLHLLSPAGRPIQVTRDLASFWETTYASVRKDLRGRYPRHHWPDNPLEAVPTKRAKPRK